MNPHANDPTDLSSTTPLPTNPSSTSSLPLPPSLSPPPDFGDYQFLERLGKGAFGEVYRVWSRSTQRDEAMKILHLPGSPRGERLEAFRIEVQRMANVPGAHVAHVYHTGVLPDGRPFFTMEHLNGGRIDTYCNRKRMTLEERILTVAEVCEAVHRLHERTLVHCDIKPGNIVVREDADVAIPKLVDFGLASVLAFRQSPTHTACGTLPYMAPEQLESRGGDPERRWDIYALGVTLYQLLVDARPIDDFPDPGLPAEELARLVRRTPVPPLIEKLSGESPERSDEIASERRLSRDKLRVRLRDPWLEAIVDKALAKNREDRYASAAEMARNLRIYAAGRRPPIVPPRLRDRAKELLLDHALAVTGTIVLLTAAALLLWAYQVKSAAQAARIAVMFTQGCAEVEPALAIRAFSQALELDPSRSDIRLHLAGVYLTSGKADEAIRIVGSIPLADRFAAEARAFAQGLEQFLARPGRGPQPARDTRPEVPPGNEYYYSLTFPASEANSAVLLLSRALESETLTHDDRFRIRFMRAMRYYQLGDFDRLSSEAQWLVETVPRSAAAWNLRGIAELGLDRKPEALRAYNRALELNPEYAAVCRNRGDLHADLGNYKQAIDDCDRAVAMNPSLRASVASARVNALVGLQDFAAAKSECEALSDESALSPQFHFACGNVWLNLDLPARAWTEFDFAVHHPVPSDPFGAELRFAAYRNRGMAAMGDGRYAEAIEDFNSAAVSDPARWHADAFDCMRRGVALLLVNRSDDATADLERFVEMRRRVPGTALVQLWLWDVHLTNGRTQEAMADLEAAAETAKPDARLTRIVRHCAGDIDAETLLSDAGGHPTLLAEAQYYLGLAAKARGDLDNARHWLEACLALSHTRQTEARFLAQWQVSALRPSP